jgi:hypothetical protein
LNDTEWDEYDDENNDTRSLGINSYDKESKIETTEMDEKGINFKNKDREENFTDITIKNNCKDRRNLFQKKKAINIYRQLCEAGGTMASKNFIHRKVRETAVQKRRRTSLNLNFMKTGDLIGISENKYAAKFRTYRKALRQFTDQFLERNAEEFKNEQKKSEKMHNDQGWGKKNAVKVTMTPKESSPNIVDLFYNENHPHKVQTSQVPTAESTMFNNNKRRTQNSITVLTRNEQKIPFLQEMLVKTFEFKQDVALQQWSKYQRTILQGIRPPERQINVTIVEDPPPPEPPDLRKLNNKDIMMGQWLQSRQRLPLSMSSLQHEANVTKKEKVTSEENDQWDPGIRSFVPMEAGSKVGRRKLRKKIPITGRAVVKLISMNINLSPGKVPSSYIWTYEFYSGSSC